MPRTIRFPFRLDAGLATVTVEQAHGHNTVQAAVCSRTRRNLEITMVDLERLEAEMEAPATVTVEALDVMTGAPAWFVVEHLGGTVYAIRYPDGISVRPSSPQFTETAEAFALDAVLAEMEAEVDVRHLMGEAPIPAR